MGKYKQTVIPETTSFWNEIQSVDELRETVFAISRADASYHLVEVCI